MYKRKNAERPKSHYCIIENGERCAAVIWEKRPAQYRCLLYDEALDGNGHPKKCEKCLKQGGELMTIGGGAR